MIRIFENKENCCGCTACENICPVNAISMQPDNEGFLYPVTDAKCIGCGKCIVVCPMNQNIAEAELTKTDYPKVYACKHKDDEVRMSCSSGGLFTALSDAMLLRNGVVYGAAHDEKLNTVHIRADNSESRDRCKISKYVQTNLLDCFKQVKTDLQNGRIVLFTGTSCHTAGLNSYLRLAKIATDNLYTADLVCHGVPSPKIFQEFVAFCETKTGKKMVEYNHRTKKYYGWGHEEEEVFSDGSVITGERLSRVWKKLFYANLILRPVCYQCRYTGTVKSGDVTMADFWGIEQTHPEFRDEKGVSMLFVNTEKGNKLYEMIKDYMYFLESSMEECMPYQANLREPSKANRQRTAFWQIYEKQGFEAVAKKFGDYGFKNEIKGKIKVVLDKLGLLDIARKILKR